MIEPKFVEVFEYPWTKNCKQSYQNGLEGVIDEIFKKHARDCEGKVQSYFKECENCNAYELGDPQYEEKSYSRKSFPERTISEKSILEESTIISLQYKVFQRL